MWELPFVYLLSDPCDEYHVVFYCDALADLWVWSGSLYTIGTLTMQDLMWQKDTRPAV